MILNKKILVHFRVWQKMTDKGCCGKSS
jgi:hypothetical protein